MCHFGAKQYDVALPILLKWAADNEHDQEVTSAIKICQKRKKKVVGKEESTNKPGGSAPSAPRDRQIQASKTSPKATTEDAAEKCEVTGNQNHSYSYLMLHNHSFFILHFTLNKF